MSVDRERFKRAIALVETEGGRNNVPRFEVSYMPGGAHFTVQGRVLVGTGRNMSPIAMARWERYGIWSSASYSSWQILYHTAADMGYDGDPRLLWFDKTAETWVDKWLDRHWADATVDRLADAWNSGTWKDKNRPEKYISAVSGWYDKLGGKPA